MSASDIAIGSKEGKHISVSEIKVEHEDMLAEWNDAKSNLHEYEKIAKEFGMSLKPFIPTQVKHNVSFKLHGVPSAFANAIRRELCSEYPCLSMRCDFTKIIHDDPLVKVDEVRTRVEAVPFQQDDLPSLEYMQDSWVIELDYENTSSIAKWVHSSNITVYDKVKKQKIQGLFGSTNPIVYLNPGRHIKIPLTLAVGRGEADGNAFKPCGMWGYKDLDRKEGKHILEYEARNFAISYQTYGNCKNPFHLIIAGVQDIIARMNMFQNIITSFKDETDKIDSSLHFTNEGQHFKYNFVSDTHTITNLYAAYVRAIIPGVFVVSGCDHPANKITFVKIAHNKPHAIMLEAGEQIIVDMKIFVSAF